MERIDLDRSSLRLTFVGISLDIDVCDDVIEFIFVLAVAAAAAAAAATVAAAVLA